ncbi:transposase [Novilysobacter selenitireducens]|uniref:transposase n=1 Tax=Novilysobacter selenitireducens TaxID=2872639 RepID=UPI0029E81426|nr:transposase [Lysobacter selenitireducens]
MPRLPRIDLPHIPQHVVQRGNDRRPCFFQPIDHVRYLDELRTAATRAGCAIHAYVLMTNHVHLLVTPGAGGQVGAMMQALGRRYVRYVNDRYGRTGTLWEGRYKACPVQSDAHLLRCYRYIELNPVRAAMVAKPGDHAWSSYAANALGTRDALVTPTRSTWRLAATTPRDCRPTVRGSPRRSRPRSWRPSATGCSASRRWALTASPR